MRKTDGRRRALPPVAAALLAVLVLVPACIPSHVGACSTTPAFASAARVSGCAM